MFTSKITLATVKRFIKANRAQLQISNRSTFNGMTDGVEACANKGFRPVQDGPAYMLRNDLGIAGAYFVLGSRDSFTAYDEAGFVGIRVYNCCGSFVLAIPKAAAKVAA